jgi:hypothetical protein
MHQHMLMHEWMVKEEKQTKLSISSIKNLVNWEQSGKFKFNGK